MQLDLQGHPAEEANNAAGLEMDGEDRRGEEWNGRKRGEERRKGKWSKEVKEGEERKGERRG